MSTKDTNPKDAVGTKKWRQYCTVPTTIIWELGVAMLEGARKYGRHNYRVAGVRASVYIDAAKGHIDQWWEGEDIDAESGLSHITKAMASLAVLRDAMINDMVTDDRPPKCNLDRVRDEMQAAVEGIFERFPNAVDPYTELGEQEKTSGGEEFDNLVDLLFEQPSPPHIITVNGLIKDLGDQTSICIDSLVRLAGLKILDSELYQIEVSMAWEGSAMKRVHGNAFTTFGGTSFEVVRVTADEKIDRGLEEKSIEERGEEVKPVTESFIEKVPVRIVGGEESPFPPYTIIVNDIDHEWHKSRITMTDLMGLACFNEESAEIFTIFHYDPVTREENEYSGDYGLTWSVTPSATFKLRIMADEAVTAEESHRAKAPFIEIVEADRPE